MNKNYIIINDNGTIIGSTLVNISQGNNKVDELYIGYLNYTSSDGYVTISASLPDNNNLPALSTSNVDFSYSSFVYNEQTYPAKTYSGFKLTLLDALTSQAGTLRLTINLKNSTNNTTLCSSILNLTIHASVLSTTPTITDAQYDTLVDTINSNYNTLNTNKLNKQFNTYSVASDINFTNDEVILNQSNTPKYAKITDIHNILSVNNVTPVNKNITLDSEHIPHDDTTVSGAITALEANVETRALKTTVSQKVGHRDGSLSTIEEVATGLLNTSTDIYIDVSTYARILYNDGFLDGDIIDVAITYNHTEDGATTSKVVNIVKIIKVNNDETLYTYGGIIAMTVSSTAIAFAFDSVNDVPTAISAKVRR